MDALATRQCDGYRAVRRSVPAPRLGPVLHLYDTATREVRELALPRARQGQHLPVRPDGVRPAPPRSRPRRRSCTTSCAATSSGRGSRCGSCRTSPTSTTRSSSAPSARGVRGRTSPPKCERVWFDAMAGINVHRPTDVPHATEYVDEMVAMIGDLIERGSAYVTDDGVYLSVETVEDYGLLAHQSLDDMRAGGGERDVFGAERKRHPADFVLWKFCEARRAVVAVTVGRRPPRLAQRVRRDEPRSARRGLRSALRWPGPALPAPRERARPGRRARQDVREPLDAQRVRGRRRGREDVEVARQRVEPARPDRPTTTRAPTGWCCCSRTTAAR